MRIHPSIPISHIQVVCPFPSGKVWETVWSCYKNEAAGSGPAFVIRSDCPWNIPGTSRPFETTGRVVQAGANKYLKKTFSPCHPKAPRKNFISTKLPREEMWSFTGADNQLWKWSESGNMLINVATGKPFAVGGFTEWRAAKPKHGDILETQFGNKVGGSIHFL